MILRIIYVVCESWTVAPPWTKRALHSVILHKCEYVTMVGAA